MVNPLTIQRCAAKNNSRIGKEINRDIAANFCISGGALFEPFAILTKAIASV